MCVRLENAGLMCWRVGWDSPREERDDTINYISRKGVKKKRCLGESCTWKEAVECYYITVVNRVYQRGG